MAYGSWLLAHGEKRRRKRLVGVTNVISMLNHHSPFATRHKRLFLLPRATRHRPYATCMIACIAGVLLVISAPHKVCGQVPKAIALLPFENVSGSVDSVHIIMPLIAQSLYDRGYQLIPLQKVESFLERNRIRNTGMLSRAQLNNLKREFGVDLALVGSVDLFYESADNPQWGLSSRIVSTDEANVLWAESTGRTGGDYTGMLGLGTITSGTDLAREVVKILFQTLPPSGSSFVTPKDEKSTAFHFFVPGGGYRSPALDNSHGWRVAVTIFDNASERKGAGRILTDVFTTALARQSRFQIIDPGEVNETLIELGRTPYSGMDMATLRDFKKRTGLDAIFHGTVYHYNEGLKREATTSPEIDMDITMLDLESGKILWFARGERSGDDSQIVLDFGIIRSMVPLIRKVVADMLNTL